MESRLKRLYDRLLGAARAAHPDDSVPLGFETRVMARLRDLKPRHAIEVWGNALWRAAGATLLVSVLCAAWMFWAPEPTTTSNGSDFASEFEEAILVAAESHVDEVW